MAGWGSREVRPRTVLIHEYVTGGGLIGRELPPTWAAEGGAMRRAIAADFAAIPGVRVTATLDARLAPDDHGPGVTTRIIADRPLEAFESLARGFDLVLAIAPETGGLLLDHARRLRALGVRSLGSEPDAVELAGDKARLASAFEAREVPTPQTRLFVPASGIPADWPGPIVVKPVDGAGSLATFVLLDRRRCPADLLALPVAIAQPYLPGEPRSASFLVDRDGRPTLLGVGRQRIEVDAEGRISYLGGVIPAEGDDDPTTLLAALACVPGLRGFVGVDYLRSAGGPILLEINPRPTTSFVGLARRLGPGAIASAWLAGLDGSPLPSLIPRCPAVDFDADGTVRPGACPP